MLGDNPSPADILILKGQGEVTAQRWKHIFVGLLGELFTVQDYCNVHDGPQYQKQVTELEVTLRRATCEKVNLIVKESKLDISIKFDKTMELFPSERESMIQTVLGAHQEKFKEAKLASDAIEQPFQTALKDLIEKETLKLETNQEAQSVTVLDNVGDAPKANLLKTWYADVLQSELNDEC